MHFSRLGLRRGLALSAAAAAGLAMTATATAASGASSAKPHTGGTTLYAIGAPACDAAPAGQARCFAVRRVLVGKNTPGARPFAARPSSVILGPGGGYTPGDIAKAYGVNPASAAGATQTVAIVDAYHDPNLITDLTAFDEQYGLPDEVAGPLTTAGNTIEVVNQLGSTTLTAANDTTGWSEEEALDVDAVRGMCNKCKILFVEGDTANDDDLAKAVDTAASMGATEITNSYGEAESGAVGDPASDVTAYNNHPGVVITASSGDDGWYDYDEFTGDNSPSTPASIPNVVAVGGTTLSLNSNGTRRTESVWNDNGPDDYFQYILNFSFPGSLGAAGSGCSVAFTAPTWQSHAAGYSNAGCGGKRLVADVAADADYLSGLDIHDTYDCTPCSQPPPTSNNSWFTIGGTSLASPLVAAMWADAGGAKGVKTPALTLYGHYKTKTDLYDVTVGGTDFCDANTDCENYSGANSWNQGGTGLETCSQDANGNVLTAVGQCEALPGFDGPGGVGVPNSIAAFSPLKPKAVVTAPSKIVKGKAASFKGTKSSDPFPGGSLSSYSWKWGDGKKSSGSAPKHTYAKAGTYTITLTVKDSYGFSGSVTKKVTVTKS
jgi:subtilase family serine protease